MVGIWRLFIDECHTKSNDFYEIDDTHTFEEVLYISLQNDICKKWELRVHSRDLNFRQSVGCIIYYELLNRNENGGIVTLDIK
jgi:hypothetical protein